MSFLSALAPVAGLALGGLFGGGGKSAPQVNYTPPGFNAGGMSATFGGNGYSVTPSADRTGAVGNIAGTFGAEAGALGNIGAGFAPGFSNLRASQLNQINSNRTAAIGDLRQNLQNRRVLGSSFAQDAVNRTQAQYDQQEKDTIAQTYLQELQASQQIIQQQYGAAVSSFQTGLTEMNLEAGVASDLTTKASTTMLSAATTQAQLDAANQAGQGKFFGQLGQMAGSAFGGMFGGGGASSSLAGKNAFSTGASASDLAFAF